MTDGYTYQQYLAFHTALNGMTTHYVPGRGTKRLLKELLTRNDFETKLARLRELEDSETWEEFELCSDLFVIELERHGRISAALQNASPGGK